MFLYMFLLKVKSHNFPISLYSQYQYKYLFFPIPLPDTTPAYYFHANTLWLTSLSLIFSVTYMCIYMYVYEQMHISSIC